MFALLDMRAELDAFMCFVFEFDPFIQKGNPGHFLNSPPLYVHGGFIIPYFALLLHEGVTYSNSKKGVTLDVHLFLSNV